MDDMQEQNDPDLTNSDTDAWVAARPDTGLRWQQTVVALTMLLLAAGTLWNWVLARRTAADLAAARETLRTLTEGQSAAGARLVELGQQSESIKQRVYALHDAWARAQQETREQLSQVGDELSVFVRRAVIAGPNWELVFEDTFERDTLGPDWDFNPEQCSCTIADGWLDAQTEKVVLCATTRDFRGNLRLEYDARGVGAGFTCDMSAYICAQLGEPLRILQGYFVGFGSDWNRLAKIQRSAVTMVERPLHLDTDRTYHMTIDRIGPDVIGYVDGTPVIYFTDPTPIRGEKQSHIALYSFRSHVRFDNLRVYRLKDGRGARAATVDGALDVRED